MFLSFVITGCWLPPNHSPVPARLGHPALGLRTAGACGVGSGRGPLAGLGSTRLHLRYSICSALKSPDFTHRRTYSKVVVNLLVCVCEAGLHAPHHVCVRGVSEETLGLSIFFETASLLIFLLSIPS